MHALPDITSHINSETSASLSWVGMEEIDTVIHLEDEVGVPVHLASKVNAYVSLDKPDSKGIHMSRLYALVNTLNNHPLDQSCVGNLLSEMIASQANLSKASKIEIAFNLTIKKNALKSSHAGFQSYPIKIVATNINSKVSTELQLTIPYSSTCPCSAALTRQLFAQTIDNTFEGDTIDKSDLLQWMESQAGTVATPHSQRSYAYIHAILNEQDWPCLSQLIRHFESVIGTPVQTAVKREDEQAFSKLNAENLMFCEDAARRVKAALEAMTFVEDYWYKVEHIESLHPHNAVVIDQKYN